MDVERALEVIRYPDSGRPSRVFDQAATVVEAEIARLRSTRAEWLREIVADVEQRYPGVREPDNRSDWGKGVAWILDRLTNIAADESR
jgi:hypothetical protein